MNFIFSDFFHTTSVGQNSILKIVKTILKIEYYSIFYFQNSFENYLENYFQNSFENYFEISEIVFLK